jgi:alcohol dehydrogenase
MMKALVYQGLDQKALIERPKPEIQAPTDAIVRMVMTTICGTDLHILKGDLATCLPGRILGHEGVGVVDQVGAGVTSFKPGDRVLISCVSACGRCEYCRKQMFSHCVTGGWILGRVDKVTYPQTERRYHDEAKEAIGSLVITGRQSAAMFKL